MAHGVKEPILRRLLIEVTAVIEDFDLAPSRTGLLEVGCLMEVLNVGPKSAIRDTMIALLSRHIRLWCKRGLLIDLLMTEPTYAYQVALLMPFATTSVVAHYELLQQEGLTGRTELPFLQQIVICSCSGSVGQARMTQLFKQLPSWFSVNSRRFRSAADDIDLFVLVQLAQVLRLPRTQCHDMRDGLVDCQLLIEELIAVAIRNGDIHRLSTLLLVQRVVSPIRDVVRNSAESLLDESVVSWDTFESSKALLHMTNSDLGYSNRVLTIRSVASWAMLGEA